MAECDMTNGGFTKVFSHDTNGGYFTDVGEAASFNTMDPTATRYSILDHMEELKSSDSYEFRMLWPNDSVNINQWTQTSNPTQNSIVSDYTAINLGCLTNSWRGLALSSASGSFLDGTDAEDIWYSIGTIDSAQGRIPSGCQQMTQMVELWFR